MQTSYFFRLRLLPYILATVAVIISLSSSYCQNSSKVSDNRCYVVVGAFKLESNAKRYVGHLAGRNMEAQYKKNIHRNLYYVYSYDSKDREQTKQKLFEIRKNFPELTESWLYTGNFKGEHITAEKWEAMMAPSVNQPEIKNTDDEPVKEESISPQENMAETDETMADENVGGTVTPEKPEVQLDNNESLIYINAYNARTLKEVDGNFKLWDGERNKEIQDIPSHKLTVIKHPPNATNKIKVSSDIFGFREAEHTLDLDDPLADGKGVVEVVGDTMVLNFEMLRFNKGDIMTLWRVYFYVDAAIMKEESVAELNQLLAMMKENDNIKIKIHGHTNGNSRGTVLHLDLDDKNFFSLNGSHHENTASAKKLSLYRAYTIQHWLMDQGISEDRMEIQGWGGKKMIYDKHDSKAHKNVRVEIEILEE